jgi:hypothetical protein
VRRCYGQVEYLISYPFVNQFFDSGFLTRYGDRTV